MTLFDNFSSEFIKSISLYWEEPHSSLGAFARSTRTKNSLLSPMQNSFCSTNQIDSVKIYIAPLEGAAITENNYQYSKSKWIFVISSHFKLYEQGITAADLFIWYLEYLISNSIHIATMRTATLVLMLSLIYSDFREVSAKAISDGKNGRIFIFELIIWLWLN